MKFGLFALLLLVCSPIAIQAQSCLTQDDVRQMLTRIDSSPPGTPNKKLKQELLKMAMKQQELLQQVVRQDQTNKSVQEKLHKTYEDHTVKLCEILKTNGWPTTALVNEEGMFAAFLILKNAPFELQRDLLPVIVATIKKDPGQKREFAGLYDRLRVSAGMKQLFGTQAVSTGGFLVLYPVEDLANLDARRTEFGLSPIAQYAKSLERTFGRPLVKSRQLPPSQLSKQLTESVTKAIDATDLGAKDIDPGDVIKTETNLVNLNVSVFNNKLKMFVGSLAKDDFRVLDNNQEQTVTYFSSTHVPFDLVLVVDLSGSTSEKRDLIKKSTLRFIEAARPDDRLAIVTFSDTTNVVSPLTLDRTQLAASVKNMAGEGGSNVWDAVKFALDNVVGPRSLERRRAVVLMSDGVDGSLMGGMGGSKTSFAEFIEKIRQTDTHIVTMFLDTESSQWEKLV
jgi:hypothetical protein